MTAPRLGLHDLSVSFPTERGRTDVVRGVDLELAAGETLGVVGESGSGKSVTLRALMGLLPGSARVESGMMSIDGRPVPLAGRGLRAARRRRLAMVFQDPSAALDPVMSIGDQIAEVPRRVFGQSRAAARATTLELLRQVQIPDPERRAAAYPHQLSGGQRQRVVIAMALATAPQILLCDEPTTALDVTIQAEVLDLLRGLRDRGGLSMIFVSHDLAVVGSMADRILVMRSGGPVELGPVRQIIDAPAQPYTRQLLDAVLELPEPAVTAAVALGKAAGPARLQAQAVTVAYGRAPAVRGVDLAVAAGEIHGLVGESGSGKTTLAKVLTGQLSPGARGITVTGTVSLDGAVLPPGRTAAQRTAVQMIYQDPYSSLDPRMTVRQTLSELLRVVRRVPREQIDVRCRELLDQVALPASALDGYPGQFSGGQRQRIAIARALAVEPRVLIADEPTSALDVSVQAAVLDLLVRLRDELGLAVVVVSHNLAVIRHICDRVSVMQGGLVVESGSAVAVLDHPEQPYTQQLIQAVPRLRKETR